MRLDKKGVAEEYSSRVRGYSVGSMATTSEGVARLRSLIKKGDVVVDVGCGPGFAVPMAMRYSGKSGRVLALDISLEMLKNARRNVVTWDFPKVGFDRPKARIRGLEGSRDSIASVFFVLCDAERLPIKSGSVAVVFAFTSIHRMDPSIASFEMWRVLGPGGYMFLNVPGAHDEDAMVFEHIPPAYLPDELPRGFPPDFKLDAAYWEEEQSSWRRFKEFCQRRIPWLAEKISLGWFNGYESLRQRYREYERGEMGEEVLEDCIAEWERDNDAGKLGWICFPTRRCFVSLLDLLEERGAVVVEACTSSFKPDIAPLLRTDRYFELYVYLYSQVVRSHTAILYKPVWTGIDKLRER